MFRNSHFFRQEVHKDIRGGIKDFVDPNYLNNKRPKVPGGPWPVDMLRRKSMGDLQQIWFLLLRERNMLLTMKDHYTRHQEELGAWPTPSRLTLVDESMVNLKRVLRERDNKANDAAAAVFRDRAARRTYRYPPGPQEPPGSRDPTSKVTLLLSRYVSEDRLRELFGRYDVAGDDRGLISVTIQPTSGALAAKEKAEEEFTRWWWAQDDIAQYSRWASPPSAAATSTGGGDDESAGAAASSFDADLPVELAPGEFLNDVADPAERQALEARNVPVPPPLDVTEQNRKIKDMLERIRREGRTYTEKVPLQLGYFPNITSAPPPAAGERPVHPDEILGPWEAVLIYAERDGSRYAKELGIERIDGAEVLELAVVYGEVSAGAEGKAPQLMPSSAPAAADCHLYDEALAIEEAAAAKEKDWPVLPEWSDEYDKILDKKPGDIIQHNWQNAVDYMEREALLTGRSIYELPIAVDPTCGEQVHIPPFAKPSVEEFPHADPLHNNI